MTRQALVTPIESMGMKTPRESTPDRAVIHLGSIACRTRSSERTLVRRELAPVLITGLRIHGYGDKSMVMDIISWGGGCPFTNRLGGGAQQGAAGGGIKSMLAGGGDM